MRFGLVPHFALGPITDVSNPASSGGDPLVFRVNDVDGWFDIRGVEIRNVGETTPSCRMPGRATAHTAKRCQTVSNPIGNVWMEKGSLTGENVQELDQYRQCR